MAEKIGVLSLFLYYMVAVKYKKKSIYCGARKYLFVNYI
ncbi:hypothetical protein AsAng_0004330 [Aureispira anguillae]|uniref:Uncharacterized protein n=1 Tax=Aureispira anguillae TaxID=2864201 RepID=A0A915Y9R5_9BACT|nr:hypothetical protein AsAng_0004330 [Aureispira anguillae]